MGLSITQAVWLIGIHSILHGIFGVFIVASSAYVNYNPALNYSYITLNGLLILLGFLLFCLVLWRRPFCARVFGALFILLAIAYLITGIIYYVTYFPFYANTVFDSFFYNQEYDCWCGPDYPLTFWHVLAFLLFFPILLWFFYGCLLCKLANCVCYIDQGPCKGPNTPCPPPCVPCVTEAPCPNIICVEKVRWYHKLFRSRQCPPPSSCPPPSCPLPSSPPPCPPPCPPPPCCPAPRTPPCSPCTKKPPKFVLTLKPQRPNCK